MAAVRFNLSKSHYNFIIYFILGVDIFLDEKLIFSVNEWTKKKYNFIDLKLQNGKK